MRTIVIGAGVTGLTAAWRLLQLRPDAEVIVVEQDPQPGGLAATWEFSNWKADLGPHRIFTELPEIQELLPQLIEREKMLTVTRQSQMLLRGHFFRYPIRVTELFRVLGPITTTGLTMSAVAGKLRPAPPTANYEEVMLSSFGRGLYNFIIKPYTRKVWKVDPARLSGDVARVRVSAGNITRMLGEMLWRRGARKPSALTSFSYIRGGVQGLVESLSSRVREQGGQLNLRQKAVGFSGGAGRINEVSLQEGNQTDNLPVDALISTIPVTNLVPMLRPIRSDIIASQAADELGYIGLILVALIIDREQMSPNSWLYFPEEHLVFNRAYESRNFDESMATGGRTMVVFEVTAMWDSDTWRSSDEDIAARVRRDVAKTGLVTDREIVDCAVRRIPYAYPLYTVDYQQRLNSVFEHLRHFANVVTTGRQGLYNHNNMDHCMLMGLRAAEYVAQNDSPAEKWYDDLAQFAHFRIVD